MRDHCKVVAIPTAQIAANSGRFALNWEISVCAGLCGGPGSCPTSSNLNYLLKVRVNRGALKLQDDFCSTRTTFGVLTAGKRSRFFIFGISIVALTGLHGHYPIAQCHSGQWRQPRRTADLRSVVL